MFNTLSRRTFFKSSTLAYLELNSSHNSFGRNHLSSEKDLTFLFQGDSITDGNRGRSLDPNHIMGHGYAFSVASRIGADFPEHNFSFYNRGVSGNKVTDLQKRWKDDTLELRPNVLSLLVGINDCNVIINKPEEATTIAQFDNIYRTLLDECRKLNSDILFVLGLPFVYPSGKRKESWEKCIKEIVVSRQDIVRGIAKDFNTVLVDYTASFDKATRSKPTDYWIWDGVHPTIFGHELMAREWIKATSSRLNFLKRYRY